MKRLMYSVLLGMLMFTGIKSVNAALEPSFYGDASTTGSTITIYIGAKGGVSWGVNGTLVFDSSRLTLTKADVTSVDSNIFNLQLPSSLADTDSMNNKKLIADSTTNTVTDAKMVKLAFKLTSTFVVGETTTIQLTDATVSDKDGNSSTAATISFSISKAEDTSVVLSFNTGTGSAVDNIVTTKGATITKPSDPTKSGYTFGGWYTDSTYTTPYTFSTAPTSNTTLYAKWVANPVSTEKAATPDTTSSSTEAASNPKTGLEFPYVILTFIILISGLILFRTKKFDRMK